MNPSYRHTQIGAVMLGILAVAVAAAISLSVWGTNPLPPFLLLLVGGALIFCSTLTVVVRDQVLDVSFWPGLIRKRIPLGRIRDVHVVRNPWYYGWGIRLTPRGWLWNVSGLRGVELHLDNGRRFRIGSDEPDTLAQVLLDARRTA